MKRNLLTLALLSTISLSSTSAFAGVDSQTTEASNSNQFTKSRFIIDLPQPLLSAEQNNYFKIISVKKADEVKTGVYAVLAKSQSKYHVYWVHEDSGLVSTGSLLTNDGFDLTSKYMDDMKPPLDLSKEFDKLKKNGVIFGSSLMPKDDANAMYIVYEPNCGYCKKMHIKLEPYIKKGLDVRFVPVAFLRPTSADTLSSILGASDPLDALKMHEMGKPLPYSKASPELLSQLAANSSFMRTLGISGTPGVIYKKSNNSYVITGGMDDDELNRVAMGLMKK
ncbi:thioredoxin fold domain-containing protein [Aliivibrio fischeri]|uniref:thioredoxin fold domain-containing protein n=1 Tax=Aliivibrio fischeri TaxID=668 RepID=UPI0012D95530|nr:thioredoxin fold domain-containing protein [Aliivibrio fischeri]MUJ20342.1 thioredoxin fold domain-containing protein [Aliivibrio fischeri]